MLTSDKFDAAQAAKRLLREARGGALATLMPGTGAPYCSLVNVATAADGSPLLLVSTLAIHTRNLLADDRVSLMLDERTTGDPLEGTRIMLSGTIARSDDPEHRRRYLARQPEAEAFAGFKDFAIYRIDVTACHLVAGFGRIVDLAPAAILTDVAEADAPTETGAARAATRKGSTCISAAAPAGCRSAKPCARRARCGKR